MYKRVYFRINTPSYYKSKYGVGFENQEDRNMFEKDITELFLNDGWELKEKRSNSGCTTIAKDKQELYLHPQSLSGVILENNISYIEDLLLKGNEFNYEKTDIYEDVFDLTDEEYLNILESKKVEIESFILEQCTTKRSNLYLSILPIDKILEKFRIKRLSSYIGVYSNSNIDWKFIEGIFESLIDEDKILTASIKSGTGYKTNKQLLKKKSA